MYTILLTIDDRKVHGESGETILSVARQHGIPIPTLCQLQGASTFGGCRLCLVEVEGIAHPVSACNTPIKAGQRVTTQSPALRADRQMVLELLFAERNHYCAVCVQNGDCELQSAAAQAGMDHVRCPYLSPSLPVDASHAQYVLDHNRCILCMRCVRVCAEVEGAHTWQMAGRGIEARLVADNGVPWGESTTCTSCGKCVHLCPTGALYRKGASVAEMQKKRGFLLRILEGRELGRTGEEPTDDFLVPTVEIRS